MKALEPGHLYIVDGYDGGNRQFIGFMKRVGEGYPGNRGEPHGGTNCQELIRVLIDRVKYLDRQIPSRQSEVILASLREALFAFEHRAAERHGIRLARPVPEQFAAIEDVETCPKCGHVLCHHD